MGMCLGFVLNTGLIMWRCFLGWTVLTQTQSLFCSLYWHATDTSLNRKLNYENKEDMKSGCMKNSEFCERIYFFPPQEPNTWNASYQDGKYSKHFSVTNHYPLATTAHQDSFKIFFFFLPTFLTSVGEQAFLLQSWANTVNIWRPKWLD